MAERLLTLATFNFKDGGWSRRHGDHRNLPLLADVAGQVPAVDVLFLQEGRAFRADGQALRFRAEELLAGSGLRSFLTRSLHGLLDAVVFLRCPPFVPVRHYTPDLPDVYHDQIGLVHANLPGLDRPVRFSSVQWAHWNGNVRLDQALRLTRHAAPGVPAVIAGDFNSLWPDCPAHPPEFEPDWAALPPHKRLHKTLPPGQRPDGRLASYRRALTVLSEAGFVSAGCAAGDITVTVSAAADCGQGARIDHIVLSPWLAHAIVPGSYRVHAGDVADPASDHRMVSVRLDLGQLG